MLEIKVTGVDGVTAMLGSYSKAASRAAERALDQTAVAIKAAEQAEMRSVFDKPVAYTINSMYVVRTKGHNMVAKVGTKTPQRMEMHYLLPQVDGGPRQLKGFELAAGGGEYDLAVGAKRTASGNISVAQAKAIVSGLRDGRNSNYVAINKQHGKLKPGVYQRYKTARGFAKKYRKGAINTLQRGRVRGGFTSAVLARGLKPVLIVKPSQRQAVKPLLDFYGVAHRTFESTFERVFTSQLASYR